MIKELFDMFYCIYDWVYNAFFAYPDFTIFHSTFVFKSTEDSEKIHHLWKEAMEEGFGEFYYNITDVFEETKGKCVEILIENKPSNVDYEYTEVVYQYKDKPYIMMTTNDKVVWPPDLTGVMKFNIPFTSISLVYEDGEVFKDVKDRFLKCAGPFNDFYGETLPMSWVIGYDEDYLKENNISLKFVNIMDQEMVLYPDDTINSQYWEPSKIEYVQD